jgi:hypothetical protein
VDLSNPHFLKRFFTSLPENEKIPLTDEILHSHLSNQELTKVCKNPDGKSYYLSEDSLQILGKRMERQGNNDGGIWGSVTAFFGVGAVALEINYGLGVGFGKAPAGLFNSALNPLALRGFVTSLASLRFNAWAALILAPIEIYENYRFYQEGKRTLGEAVQDGVTDVAIGIASGTVGMAAGMEFGAFAGSFIPVPGVGTAIGMVAGAAIGYGVGCLLNEWKNAA